MRPDAQALATIGHAYYRQGFFEAAADYWHEALAAGLAAVEAARVYDGLGKMAARRGRPGDAVPSFRRALALTPRDERVARATIGMRSAIALAMAGRQDQALREARQLLNEAAGRVPDAIYGVLLANLAAMQTDHGYHELALKSLEQAWRYFGPAEQGRYGYAVHVNWGTSLLELGLIAESREEFRAALGCATGNDIRAVNGLAHIALKEGQWQEMREWGERAFQTMWVSLMGFETEELADLTQVLGQMGLALGNGRLATRFLDLAQTLYGRLGRWTRWRVIDELIQQAESLGRTSHVSPMEVDLERFAVLLEGRLAQELVGSAVHATVELRNQMSRTVVESLRWSQERMDHLTYVCRLADLGLSVTGEPKADAGPASLTYYHQHPAMSVKLLDRLGLPVEVLAGILDHHERWDGEGFPDGKRGENIADMAQVFSVGDRYAELTLSQAMPHRQVLEQLRQEAGNRLPPHLVDHLQHTFDQVLALQ